MKFGDIRPLAKVFHGIMKSYLFLKLATAVKRSRGGPLVRFTLSRVTQKPLCLNVAAALLQVCNKSGFSEKETDYCLFGGNDIDFPFHPQL